MKPIFEGFFDGIQIALAIFCTLCVIGIILNLFSC